MTVPRDHPVLELLRARRAGTAPADGARLALVVEGGGMRGVVSAGMAAGLDGAGVTEHLDLVAGASAGAMNAAALLAGVAEGGCAAYSAHLATRRFINPWRLLGGRAAIDVAYALDHASGSLDSDRHARTTASRVELHCVATDVATAEAVDLTGMASIEELKQALLASSRLPWVGGPPVEFRGRRLLDGSLAEAVPVATAERCGATHVLVLQTRPEGVPRQSPSAAADRIIERRLRALNPRLVDLYRARIADYEAVVARIGRLSATPGAAPPHVLGLRPPPGSPVVAQFERDPQRLRAAADHGRAAAEAFVTLL